MYILRRWFLMIYIIHTHLLLFELNKNLTFVLSFIQYKHTLINKYNNEHIYY